MTAWKVWQIWSDARVFGSGPTFLDDTNVQHRLVPGLIDSEKVHTLPHANESSIILVQHCRIVLLQLVQSNTW